MGVADFLKGLVKSAEETTLNFDELDPWIEKRETEIGDEERETFLLMQKRVEELNKGLEEGVSVLKEVDLEARKAGGRAESIVKSNRNNYITHVNNLKESLYDSEEENLGPYLVLMRNTLAEFYRKSHVSYEKASLLIGKELAEVKRIVTSFSRDLEKLAEKKKGVITSSERTSFLRQKVSQLDEIEESIHEIEKNIGSLNEKVKKSQREERRIAAENSKSSAAAQQKEAERESSVRALELDIHQLRSMINFKALANIFHVSQKQMSKVRAHKEGFAIALEKDNGTTLLALLDEANMNSEAIITKVKLINEKRAGIRPGKEYGIESSVALKTLRSELKELQKEQSHELKRIEKLKESRKELRASLREELTAMNVVLKRPQARAQSR